ncbi:MAG: single-stranded-DNA-specific exonuclease [Solirubrobacterales bacterium]|nr:single-stranded-DNA-specific exonuclease [Solirubrobacterales bacterium]
MNPSGWAQGQKSFRLSPYSYSQAAEIARELDVPGPVAVALVRRGHCTAEGAREFLAADERHDPSKFAGMEAAIAAIRGAIAVEKQITVHGDYDVDGVTSTTILVRALREAGAKCDWLIPGRVEDGYGLSLDAVDRLAERGTGLLITVDCGITSVDEVAHARSLGMDVVVTDHHQPGADLPDCPIVHPVISGYPCPDLCAAGVAHKVAAALLGVERAERDLDLVALATVADMVPLLGENRSLVRRGLDQMRRAPRVGLRALMQVSKVAPERVNETDIGFRLSPRINAAGRLYRADAAVELFLGDDPDRAGEIAVELDRANHDRRETEREVLADANRLLAELEAEREPGAAIVLWGEGWHPGVVGICASRMAERHLRPAILIALDADGHGKGSGRSVPGFDLLGALRACSENLARFGGHRAAAGLEIAAENLEAFRESLVAHCAQILPSEPAARVEEIDAVVGTEALGHELATQMARLGPFGMGNPEVRFVVPGARVDDVRPMGEEERHARFTLRGGPGQVSGVAFGVGGTLAKRAAQGPVDASVRLELNEWNGATEPRAVLGTLYEPTEAPSNDAWRATDAEWTERLAAALDGPVRSFATPEGERPSLPPIGRTHGRSITERREVVDRRAASGLAVVGELASSGERVLVLCADALWRRGIVESAVHPGRYGGTSGVVVAARGSLAAADADANVVLADWSALSLLPELPSGFEHVVIADPAPHPRPAELAVGGDGYLHVLAATHDLSQRAVAGSLPDRKALAEVYRALHDAGDPLESEALRTALCGPGGAGRSPETCGLALRVLAEIGVVRVVPSGPAIRVESVSSVRGDLSSSMSFRLIEKAYEECVRYLSQPEKQSSSPLEAAA